MSSLYKELGREEEQTGRREAGGRKIERKEEHFYSIFYVPDAFLNTFHMRAF